MEGLIKPFLQQVQCTVLSANIKPDDKLAPQMSGNFFPFKIFDVDSQKVGVVGYTSQETPPLSQPGTVDINHLFLFVSVLLKN